MTILNYLGLVLVASPFIGIFVLASVLMGTLTAIGIFAVTGVILAVIAGGVYLANS